MTDRRITPVEDAEMAPVPVQVPAVEVVVLDRLRYARGGKLVAQPRESRLELP